MAEELSPWASIIANPACIPIFVPVKAPASIKAMWPIDEYAISDFISACRRQIIDVITPPIKAIDRIKGDVILLM